MVPAGCFTGAFRVLLIAREVSSRVGVFAGLRGALTVPPRATGPRPRRARLTATLIGLPGSMGGGKDSPRPLHHDYPRPDRPNVMERSSTLSDRSAAAVTSAGIAAVAPCRRSSSRSGARQPPSTCSHAPIRPQTARDGASELAVHQRRHPHRRRIRWGGAPAAAC
jgi:hypothetical protein